jgi:hypothetical protein
MFYIGPSLIKFASEREELRIRSVGDMISTLFSFLLNFIALMIFTSKFFYLFSHKFVSLGLVFLHIFYFKFHQNFKNSNSNQSVVAEPTKLDQTGFVNIHESQTVFKVLAIRGSGTV